MSESTPFPLSRPRTLWLCLLFLLAGVMAAQAEPVPLTNMEGVSIKAEILAYDRATGMLTGDRVGGGQFTISMEDLDLKSKVLVFMSPAGVEGLQGWVPPLATMGTLFAVLVLIFTVIDFLGYWPGAAMVEGTWAFWPHLRAFLILLVISIIANFIQGVVTAMSGEQAPFASCFISLIAFILSVTAINAVYRIYNWFQAFLLLLCSLVTRVLVYAIVITGFAFGHIYKLYDGNALLTDWILKPMELM